MLSRSRYFTIFAIFKILKCQNWMVPSLSGEIGVPHSYMWVLFDRDRFSESPPPLFLSLLFNSWRDLIGWHRPLSNKHLEFDYSDMYIGNHLISKFSFLIFTFLIFVATILEKILEKFAVFMLYWEKLCSLLLCRDFYFSVIFRQNFVEISVFASIFDHFWPFLTFSNSRGLPFVSVFRSFLT